MQFLGSYGVEISSDGRTLTFTVFNETGLESFTRVLPNDSLGQFGQTVYEEITFNEPIDIGRLEP